MSCGRGGSASDAVVGRGDAGGRGREAGFTLIEALVAMAVLSVGALSLLGAAQSHVARVGGIEERTVARWVAETRLAALRVGLDGLPAQERAMGRDWRVETVLAPTADPGLARVDLRVGAEGAAGAVLTGFAAMEVEE